MPCSESGFFGGRGAVAHPARTHEVARMAEAVRFVCGSCRRAVTAWSDGNPYYFDAAGTKHYAYHPDHEALARCVGNDSPHLCLACGEEFLLDSERPAAACPACGAAGAAETYELGGQPGPFCKRGTFGQDEDFFCVS